MNSRLLLALSLALNAGMATLLILQTASRPTSRDKLPELAPDQFGLAEASDTDPDENDQLLRLDYSRLFGALRATGLPRNEIDQILRGAALSDWQDDLRSLKDSTSDSIDAETLGMLIELRRARESALSKITEKEEFLVSHGWMLGESWDKIPSEKLKAIVMLEEDYHLLFAEAEASQNPASQKETIELLQKERNQDLASILTDDELALYKAATSFGSDEPASKPETAISEEIESRNSDPVFQELHRLTERFNLSSERAAEVYELRRVVQAQREEMDSDSNLSPDQRQQAKHHLTDDAREVIRMILGDDAFEVYLKNGGDWLKEEQE